jgi:hypothetical protein
VTRASAELARSVLRAHGIKSEVWRRKRGFALVATAKGDRAERLARGLRRYQRTDLGKGAEWF